MKQEDNYQPELFSQAKDHSQTKTYIPHSILASLRAYEKSIVIIISLVVIGIISFSLGVEKGKRIAAKLQPAALQTAVSPVAVSNPTLKEEQPPVLIRQELKEAIGSYTINYTIQVASYRTKTHAEKEAGALKKKGFSPFVLSKGEFSVVCVGNFPKQGSAKSLLTELKKQYRDCYVRRL